MVNNSFKSPLGTFSVLLINITLLLYFRLVFATSSKNPFCLITENGSMQERHNEKYPRIELKGKYLPFILTKLTTTICICKR